MNSISNSSICHKPISTKHPLFKTQLDPKVLQTASLPANSSPPVNSAFRRVFTSDELKNQFVKFLKTIFYVLDEKKVLAKMDEILSDLAKTDEEVYKELQHNIVGLKKRVPLFHKIKSLFVLKKGMETQAAELTQGMNKTHFQNYLEIYDRRYLKTLQAIGMPLKGQAVAVCNSGVVTFADRLQAGAVLSKYPYKTHIPLNDLDCVDPFATPEKTHKAISQMDVPNESMDVVACLGGLHHVPFARRDVFTDSIHRVLKPGGLLLFRDHDAKTEDLKAIASVVHSFVNVTDEVSWEVEEKEVRDFRSMEQWADFLKIYGFTQISTKELVLEDDPTANAMAAFIRTPKNVDELKQSMLYRSDYVRPKQGTRATWIEWGNVRSAEQYAEFIQTHHDYAFDYIGHFRQHWKHFYHYVKECIKDKEVSLKDLIFSDNMAMNLFILTTASIQCSLSAIANIPSRMVARWKHGKNWRNVNNLTELEKFHAKTALEYSQFIQHTPFYMFDNLGKIQEMWKTIWNSKEGLGTQLGSALSAVGSTLGFLANAVIAAPVRAIYTAESNQEPDTIQMIVKDANNDLQKVIDQWEKEKDPELNKNYKIEVLIETEDGHKLISVPRYRSFTKICSYIAKQATLVPIEIGGQTEISIDVLLNKEETLPAMEGVYQVYELEKLQDAEQRRYVTYQVQMEALKFFQNTAKESIVYLHE